MDAGDRIIAFDTALGICAVRWTDAGVASVRLPSSRTAGLPRSADIGQLPDSVRTAIYGITALLGGTSVDLRFVALDERGIDPFRREVYAATRSIGRPDAARDVGAALASNPFPIVVPCHRVVGANGKLTGFSGPGGLGTKRRMLELEGAPGYGQQTLFG